MAIKAESRRQIVLFRQESLDRVVARKDAPEFRPAVETLLGFAEQGMALRPPSVMDKKFTPPSDDKHDYMSLSTYVWPNPDTPDGLPYVYRDGEQNPEGKLYDRPNMAVMATAVHELALAYRITGEERYAAKAATLLRTWFLDPATRMNPNMLYAQVWPGGENVDFLKRYQPIYVPGVRGKGVWCSFGGTIDGSILTPMLESVGLLAGSPAWTEADQAGLREWFDQYLYWLLTSRHGQDEASCANNHSTWHCVDIISFALFAGREDVAHRWLTREVPERLISQIAPDGSVPEELVRSISFHYVCFTLVAFCDLAMLGERLDVDLWNAEFDGRGLRKAVDWLADHLNDTVEEFPGPNIHGIDHTYAIPVLALAADAYDEPRYRELLAGLTDYPADHRYRLVYPMD